MSLERKDVRLKLDHDIHAAAKAIADTEGDESEGGVVNKGERISDVASRLVVG